VAAICGNVAEYYCSVCMTYLGCTSMSTPPHDGVERRWTPVSPVLLAVLLVFFGVFLYGSAHDIPVSHVTNSVFMQIHAGGHALFRVFGLTAAVAGGTFLQLFVPFALGVVFIRQRHTLGVAVCMFFFFEQFLPVARYMADAQAQKLPWLSIGRYESSIHDWNYLFGELGVLPYATTIAGVVHLLGSLGMVSVTAWFLWRGVNDIVLGIS
jgi:hypothetical protein